MTNPSTTFSGLEELNQFVQQKEVGHFTLPYQNCEGYPGMVMGKGIIFNVPKGKYELDLEWISFGLDLYGENLLENYLYQFESLQALLQYLEAKYHILPQHISTTFKGDYSQFPNPIKNEDQKPEFEAAWKRFQDDFKRGIFLDDSLKLVYSTLEF